MYEKLYPARQARNRLVHDGKDVHANIAKDALKAMYELFESALCASNIPLKKVIPLAEDRHKENTPE